MWTQIVATCLGAWLMAASAVLAYGPPAATNDRIVGPMALSFAFVALKKVTRGVRRLNLPLGVWLVAAPWVLGYGATVAIVNSAVVGALLIACALARGRVVQPYGGGWAVLLPGRDVDEAVRHGPGASGAAR
jgi:hypothetical protein